MRTDFLNKTTKILLGSFFIYAAFFLFALTAHAHTIPTPSCPIASQDGRIIINFNGTDRLVSDSTESAASSQIVSTSIQPGNYKISLVSFDGHTKQRVSEQQPNESWYLLFKNGALNIAQSSPISDLEDGVATAFLTEEVDTNLKISNSIDSVLAFHAAYLDTTSSNSVVPVCAALDLITPPSLPEVTPTGSISVCKVIVDENGDLINGTTLATLTPTTFNIPILKGGIYSTAQSFYTASFNSESFIPNRKIFSDSIGYDAECVLLDDLDIDSYFYEQETISPGDNWLEPFYNDQYSVPVLSTSDLFSYSGELLNSDPGDDSNRNLNSDGQISLSESNPNRTLVILNRYNQEVNLYQCNDGVTNDNDDLVDIEDPACHTDNDASNQDSYDPTIDNENEKPVIDLKGDNPLNLTVGDVFTDPKATATDAEDGDITSSIVVGGDVVDANAAGSYTITYNVTDFDGAAADEVTRDVVVEELSPNQKPVISLIGSSTITLTVGGSFTDPGATASDLEDGDITNDIVAAGSVNTNAVGSYTITYNVSDSDGLAADEKIRTVTVRSGGGGGGTAHECSDNKDNDGDGFTDYPEDKGCTFSDDDSENDTPEITLVGNPVVTIVEGDAFTDSGATAYDVEDGDISSNIVVGGEVVATSTPVGIYTITYNVKDSNGAVAEEVTREVIVEISGVGGGPQAQCSDGLDNDGDGLTDYPSDPGCSSANDDDEYNSPVVTEEPKQCNYLLEYLRISKENNPVEVRKLQVFLRDYEGFTDLAVTGIFDQETFDAVSAFQTKYKSDILTPWGSVLPTAYVYITTKKKINEIYCQSEFPLTNTQLKEIDDYKERTSSKAQDTDINKVIGESPKDESGDSLVDVGSGEIKVIEGSMIDAADESGIPEQNVNDVVGLNSESASSTDVIGVLAEDEGGAEPKVQGLANASNLLGDKTENKELSASALAVTSTSLGGRFASGSMFWVFFALLSIGAYFYFKYRKGLESSKLENKKEE